MRNHYWTCSKFADWIRGTTKGGAKTAEGWDEWEKAAKAKYPIRWWIAEEGLDILQKIVYWPTDKLYAIKYYINNRWVTRTHALTASPRDIPRGEWRDVGNRFLPCLFNELQDFVEVELAWWHIAWDDEAKKNIKHRFGRGAGSVGELGVARRRGWTTSTGRANSFGEKKNANQEARILDSQLTKQKKL